MKTTLEQLAGFLGNANKHTYAADGVKTESSRTASDDFEYKEGDLANFEGEEQILYNDKVVYKAVYHGGLLK